ncbi:MAG: hypothetical protein QM667_11680 [Asticcacaulis sp.]
MPQPSVSRLMVCTALIGSLLLGAPLAYAEPEEDGAVAEEVTPKAKPRPKPKPKATAPKASAPKLPDAPIPYAQLSGTPDAHKTETQKTTGHSAKTPDTSHAPTVAATPLPPVMATPTAPAYAPPPPPPPPMTPEIIPAATHDLKCETQVVGPKGLISKGSFYLEVELSAVFPDDTARFRMTMAQPRHQSLLKDTACETVDCRATISPNYFDLYNSRTKRGAQLRVTLDRHTGAYLARQTDGKLPLGASTVLKEGPGLYEEGYCTPQTRPAKLF